MNQFFEKKIFKISTIALIFIFYVIISYNNRFDVDFFFASGDNYQVTDLSNYLYKKYGLWEFFQNGRVDNQYFSNYFYLILKIFFSLFKIDNNLTSVYLTFAYLFFSFVSFYISIKILNLNLDFLNKVILSLSYSINFFVFYIFWYTWGYTTTITIYIFIPIFISSFFAFNLEKDIKKKINLLIKIIPIIFLGNVAFGNIAWLLIVLLIYFLIYLILNLKFIKEKKFYELINNFKFFILFIFTFIFFTFGSIVINYISIQDIGTISSFNQENLFNWLFWQSQQLPSAFFFTKHYQFINTLYNLQYLTIINYIIIFYLIYKIDKWDISFKVFTTLLFILIFFTFKGISIFPEILVEFLFGKTLFYSFRSEDKSSVMLPYFCLTIIAFGISYLNKKKIIISILVLLINFASSFPIITGGIQENHGINIDKVVKPNFKSQKKIDDDIKNFKKITNSDVEHIFYNMLETPHSITVSPGWNDFLNSSHRGISYFEQFTKFQLINLNSNNYLLGENVLAVWNQSSEVSDWDINILQLLSVKYILHHKDAPLTKFNNPEKIINLEKDKIIRNIYEGKNINIYEVNKKYLKKKVYIPKNIFFGSLLEKNLNGTLSKNRELDTLDFGFISKNVLNSIYVSASEILKKKDLVKKTQIENKNFDTKINFETDDLLKFSVKNPKDKFYVAFTQNYNKFWDLKCLNCSDKVKINHLKLNQNLNGWLITGKNENSEIKFQLNYRLNNLINVYFYILIAFYLFALWIRRKFL